MTETLSAEPGPLVKGHNLMHPIRWVPPEASSLLDVGCNVGAFLDQCRRAYPRLRLAGVEINKASLEAARRRLPEVDLRDAGGDDLPFDDESFDCVTCIEVLEHIPAALRARALSEMRRVLRPGGRLVLSTPHAGAFAFLDACNLRFRFPGLYRRVVGRGRRDDGYQGEHSEIVWHHHFTRRELRDLAGEGWEVERWRRGGLFLVPLVDLARWPFYRTGRGDHPLSRALERLAILDLGLDFGPASWGVMMVLRRA